MMLLKYYSLPYCGLAFGRFAPVFRRMAMGLVLMLGSISLSADVRMPALFSDHMVLQQDLVLPVWGWADPGERVEVRFADQIRSTYADASGRWKVHLQPVAVERYSRVMEVHGHSNRILIRDILVGDVWLCSGQSNMEMGLSLTHDAGEAIPQANHPEIRLFDVTLAVAFSPAEDCIGRWVVCTPESVAEAGRWKGFSAVGYHFGREIQSARGQPVGLISSAVGGTPAEAWTSREALAAHPELAHYATQFESTRTQLPELQQDYDDRVLPEWERQRESWKSHPAPRPALARRPASPSKSPWQPVVLHQGMIAPLRGFGLKGVIWYQGESNASTLERVHEYESLFPAMIRDWRHQWGQGDFPFLFVQLAGWGKGQYFPELREAQSKVLSLPNTAMVVALDVGEERDIHPHNKQIIGHRLALEARRLVYGEKVSSRGPTLTHVTQELTQLRVHFENTDEGLIIGTPERDGAGIESTPPNGLLHGFEVSGATGKFIPAQARIEGDTVVVWSTSQSMPVGVRYGWAPFPFPASNLYNGAGLPAAPFRTE